MPILILLLLVSASLFGPPPEVPISYSHNTESETRVVENIALPFLPPLLETDAQAEKEMLELINAERSTAGLNELALDPEISEVARLHSEDMWRRQYFAHENPDDESPIERMSEGDIDFEFAGENLALARTVLRAHRGLMESPGHRENILDPGFRRVGIGVVDGGMYGKMFTQNFAD